jgi:hypothetical protein
LFWKLVQLAAGSGYSDGACVQGSWTSEQFHLNLFSLLEIAMLVGFLCVSIFKKISVRAWFRSSLVAGLILMKCARMARSIGQFAVLPDRVWDEFCWRMLLGFCLNPGPMFAASILHTMGTIVLYMWRIPDSMILMPFSTSAGMGLQQSCGSLWSAEYLQRLMTFSDWGSHWWAVKYESDDMRFNQQILFTSLLRQQTSTSMFILVEILIVLLVVSCLLAAHRFMVHNLQRNFRLHSSEQLVTAISDMLDRLCDAVVHTDENFVISRPTPRFAALMGSVSCQEGEDLRTRMTPEGSKVLTTTFSHNDAVGTELPDTPLLTPPVDFMDALGLKVSCSFYPASYTDLNGKRHFVIGINEAGERDRPFSDEGQRQAVVGLGRKQLLGTITENFRRFDDNGQTTYSSPRTPRILDSASASKDLRASEDPEPAQLKLRLQRGEFVSSTPAALELLALESISGITMPAIIVRPTKLENVLNEVVTKFAEGTLVPPYCTEIGPVKLKTRGIYVNLSIYFGERNQDEAFDDYVVSITLIPLHLHSSSTLSARPNVQKEPGRPHIDGPNEAKRGADQGLPQEEQEHPQDVPALTAGSDDGQSSHASSMGAESSTGVESPVSVDTDGTDRREGCCIQIHLADGSITSATPAALELLRISDISGVKADHVLDRPSVLRKWLNECLQEISICAIALPHYAETPPLKLRLRNIRVRIGITFPCGDPSTSVGRSVSAKLMQVSVSSQAGTPARTSSGQLSDPSRGCSVSKVVVSI